MPDELVVILGVEAAVLLFVAAMTLHARRMDVLSGRFFETAAASPAHSRWPAISPGARAGSAAVDQVVGPCRHDDAAKSPALASRGQTPAVQPSGEDESPVPVRGSFSPARCTACSRIRRDPAGSCMRGEVVWLAEARNFLKARPWPLNGLRKQDRALRPGVLMKTSTGMPGKSLANPNLASWSAFARTRPTNFPEEATTTRIESRRILFVAATSLTTSIAIHEHASGPFDP